MAWPSLSVQFQLYRCPRFADCVQRLVAFYRRRRDTVRRTAMV
jgi:hypothetical protein